MGSPGTIVPADIEVACAPDGNHALEFLETETFVVVVTDIRMAGADGMTVLRKIREAGLDTAVILMTAYGTIGDAVHAMKHGASDYLTKPFDTDVVVAAIESAIERRPAQAPRVPSPGIASLPYREVIATERERATREYLVALLTEMQGKVTQCGSPRRWTARWRCRRRSLPAARFGTSSR
jgi:DNA-binding NtrC family response regulator